MFLPFNTLLYFWLFLKLKFLFHTEFVSFVNLIVGLRVCFVNISPSFYRLTLTFDYDFPSTHHPHAHNSPQNTYWLVNVLVSGEKPLLVRRILIKTPLGKPQRLLVKLLLLLLNNKPSRPGQTLATFQRNVLQHCWAQHVAYAWPPCCDMLQHVGWCWIKVKNGKLFLATF